MKMWILIPEIEPILHRLLEVAWSTHFTHCGRTNQNSNGISDSLETKYLRWIIWNDILLYCMFLIEYISKHYNLFFFWKKLKVDQARLTRSSRRESSPRWTSRSRWHQTYLTGALVQMNSQNVSGFLMEKLPRHSGLILTKMWNWNVVFNCHMENHLPTGNLRHWHPRWPLNHWKVQLREWLLFPSAKGSKSTLENWANITLLAQENFWVSASCSC